MNYANRGIEAETIIELVNRQYRAQLVAQIHKVPTEWKPIRNACGKIVSAKVERKAAVDFLGNHLGKAIAFDVKSTKLKLWSLNNVSQEQIDYLETEHKLGGHSFIVIVFWKTSELYVIPFEYLRQTYDNWKQKRGPASFSRDLLYTLFEPLMLERPYYLSRVTEGYYRESDHKKTGQRVAEC